MFPLSNWTELDIWQYILAEGIDIVPLYFAAERPVVERSGQLIMVDDERMRLLPGEVPQKRRVRFRTLGCYPLTAAIESDASDLTEIVAEMFVARTSERQGRLIDHDEAGVDGDEEARGLFLMAASPRRSRRRSLPSSPSTEDKGLLRFLTCGSVDDGKSTLIGRLLHDSKRLFEDQLATLRADSARFGTTGDDIDFALLVDGLAAEREQGITIDVAYRYFATERRRFIVADTPGHVQYTRNMATGASTSDLAVLLVDAQNGILTQTRRHAYIVSLLGIRHVVLAVNKIDLIGFDEETFVDIRNAFAEFAAPLGFATLVTIPLAARHGDNIIERSARTPWYGGPTLLDHLEQVSVAAESVDGAFRLPVQWVNRPNASFRGYAGTIASGSVKPGDAIIVARTGQTANVARLVAMDGDMPLAAVRRRHYGHDRSSRSTSAAATYCRRPTSDPRSPIRSPRT